VSDTFGETEEWLGVMSVRAISAFLILAVVFICLGSSPSRDMNSDVGDPDQVAAIRHDVPILLEARLSSPRQSPVIKWVVADGSRAITTWDAGEVGGLIALSLHSGKWRLVGETTRDKDGWWSPIGDSPGCRHNNSLEPSAQELVDAKFIDSGLRTSLESRLVPNVPTTPRQEPIVDCYYMDAVEVTKHYIMTFIPHYNEATRTAFSFVKLPPNDADDILSSGDSFRFGVALHDWSGQPSAKVATVDGAQLTIWPPFVIDPRYAYILNLDGVVPPVGALKATVEDNTLIFHLRRFTMRADTAAYGVVRVH
jgi:hypothetical protein